MGLLYVVTLARALFNDMPVAVGTIFLINTREDKKNPFQRSRPLERIRYALCCTLSYSARLRKEAFLRKPERGKGEFFESLGALFLKNGARSPAPPRPPLPCSFFFGSMPSIV